MVAVVLWNMHFLALMVWESLINLFVIYWFPNTSVLTFCNDLADVLEESILNLTGYVLLVGNFNIHVDQVHNLDSITFSDFLDSFGLSNKVQFLTHKHQHTLDLVISSCMDGFIQSVFRGHLLSNHNFIHWKLRVGKEDRVLTKQLGALRISTIVDLVGELVMNYRIM